MAARFLLWVMRDLFVDSRKQTPLTPILTVENLTRTYGAKPALDHVSFNLYPGDIVGLLGLNGAGKSTALSLLSGRLLADSGHIRFEGQDISNSDTRPNPIGYVPEGAPLFEDLTVQAQLQTLAGLYGLDKKRRRPAIETMLERFELNDVRRKQISTLSKGYKRRVALAGAFVASPRLLFLDEPTDGLDPVQKGRMLSLLRDTGAEQTLLISTHSLDDVARLCDRVIILRGGKLVFDDTLKALAELGGDTGLHGGFLQLAGEDEPA